LATTKRGLDNLGKEVFLQLHRLQEELEKMKEATSGGTGRNYVVVEAHRCAKGTQPPGTVGYLERVLKG
jgi:hypothetical protein